MPRSWLYRRIFWRPVPRFSPIFCALADKNNPETSEMLKNSKKRFVPQIFSWIFLKFSRKNQKFSRKIWNFSDFQEFSGIFLFFYWKKLKKMFFEKFWNFWKFSWKKRLLWPKIPKKASGAHCTLCEVAVSSLSCASNWPRDFRVE